MQGRGRMLGVGRESEPLGRRTTGALLLAGNVATGSYPSATPAGHRVHSGLLSGGEVLWGVATHSKVGAPHLQKHPLSSQAWSGGGFLKASKSCEQEVLGGSRELGPLGPREVGGALRPAVGNCEARPGSTQAPAHSEGAEAICGVFWDRVFSNK